VPLSDRDYMKNPPPPRRSMRFTGWGGFNLSPMWVLIIVNLAVYIVTSVSDNALFNLGLIPELLSDKPWTLLTAMFVHSSFWHFFFNMVALYFFGSTLIRLVGSGRFLLVYFVGGIIGNVLYLLLNLSSIGILVGASGAVYAITGALVVMIPNMRVALWGIVPMPLWAFVIVFMILLSLPPFIDSNIAWQAHLGGLTVGLIAGFFFRRRIHYNFYR
jgi:membrane associated rhomboid family serine protease